MWKMIKSRKKTSAVIVVVLALLVHHFTHKSSPSNSIARDAIPVEVVQIQPGNIAIEAQAVGTLVAAKDIQITPEIAGHVAKVLVQDGSLVKQGTPLVQLDDAEYKARLDSANADLSYSTNAYKRRASVEARGIVSKDDVEKALSDLKEKQASVEQDQVELSRMQLTAPFDGMVGKIKVSPGDYVSVGQSIVSLTDVQHLRVEYTVSEKYLSQLKLGQPVKITTSAYPGKEFTGAVAFISPTINASDHTISLYADVPNQDRLLTAGLFVNVTQQLGATNHALVVPTASLIATIDGQQIYKIIKDKAVSVPITIVQRTKEDVQIASGIAPGDKIVIAGQDQLKEGARVEIVKSEAKA